MSFSLFIFTQCDTSAYLNAHKADILEGKQLIYRGLHYFLKHSHYSIECYYYF